MKFNKLNVEKFREQTYVRIRTARQRESGTAQQIVTSHRHFQIIWGILALVIFLLLKNGIKLILKHI
ncbi:MAG: hypothetical protein IKE69_03245 [Thermoguttaceae bacterium]|nr:hypothetical protein [Thermoguttaceae bacterium]